MTQKLNTGNSIQPLRNVAALSKLVKRVENRNLGLPGLAVLYGPPGYGKSYACAYAAAQMDCIHISIQSLWTKKTLLTTILKELSIMPTKTMAEMMMQINEGLARSRRTLIVDEADYACSRGLIEMIRDMQDGSEAPVILVGMETLPQKLRKWELVDSRVLSYQAAEPADYADAALLATVYAKGIKVDAAIIEKLVVITKGSARRISTCFARISEEAHLQGVSEMTLGDWGDRPFENSEAPQPRSYLS